SEKRPATRSIVVGKPEYNWSKAVLEQKKIRNKDHFEKPMAIYELHIGTWKRNKQGDFLNYRDLVEELVPYVKEQGFTHIEIMPITEHPLDESWGYQTTGYFAPTSRFGTGDDLKYFIEKCTEQDVGLFLDWVPGHFCQDTHALAMFNGTPLYEEKREDRRMNPDWGTLNFDVLKGEIISFILSSGHYWLKEFNFDGIRMDAVVNLLFIPNVHGRPHNHEGADFLRVLTTSLRKQHPEAILIAEDAWHFPKVTDEVEEGGIGFHYKWNFGWMNDTQRYMEAEPSKRHQIHGKINFSLIYHYEARYISTFSHDEVIPGKGSLLGKLPGSYEEKFHQLRLLLGFWLTHPGKKLLFMGQEFGHFDEWDFRPQMDWFLLEYESHRRMALFTKDLLTFYKNEKAFYELDDDRRGFTWLDPDNHEQSVASFIRRGKSDTDECIVVCNFSDRDYPEFKVGVPHVGWYEQVFSTADKKYGGEADQSEPAAQAENRSWDGQANSMKIHLPALSMGVWKYKLDGSG
ncbi:MAG TPA: 1,4-alpha-glucan branching protein GlgB, partial [Planococcus sp. (in: firmicutes)]|nr:1,4-alpha-glucan branching protein GlgB [Planococcus sp. (in: firmicutes)]